MAHVVWATKDRAALIDDAREAWLLATLARIALSHGGVVIASGAAPDHVHLLLRWDEVLALSTVVGRIKGATSHAWNRSFTDVPLVWQDGFWAESCAAEPPAELTAYVRGQRAHHGSNALDGAWELGTAG